MDSSQKKSLTAILWIKPFSEIFNKLCVSIELSEDEKTFILGIALLFLDFYKNNSAINSYLELAYFIILKYTITYKDYQPLYDFSVNFGFYPIVRSIISNWLLEDEKITDVLIDIQVNKFNYNNYVDTLEQNIIKNKVLLDSSREISYIAPTSFGKSSIITDYIVQYWYKDKKIGIIVPTKSLLAQTHRKIRDAKLNIRI